MPSAHEARRGPSDAGSRAAPVDISVVANDEDIDGNQLTVTVVFPQAPAHGSVVKKTGSQVTYTPGEIFEQRGVAVVVRGEPEETVRDLALRHGRG